MNSGGVKRSHCSMILFEAGLRLIMTAPIIMHTSSEERSHISHSASPPSTAAMVRESMLPREWKKRAASACTRPMPAPSSREPAICSSGEMSMLCTVSASPL